MIDSFISNMTDRATSVMDAATQAVAKSARIEGPTALNEAQGLFAFDTLETASSEEAELVVSQEAGFLDPATFFKNLAEGFEMLQSIPGVIELLAVLAESGKPLEKELTSLPGSMESLMKDMSPEATYEMDQNSSDQMDSLPVLQDMLSVVGGFVSLYQQSSASSVKRYA